jgi:amidase
MARALLLEFQLPLWKIVVSAIDSIVLALGLIDRYGSPMNPDGILDLDATAQADAVRSKQITPLELVDAAIARAEATNPTLNAIIHERYDGARAEAAATDIASGPFPGVPMVVKDLTLMMAGEPYYAGTRALQSIDFRAPVDSYLHEKFRAAGFVVIGRTNTPELGTTITTEPLSMGPTRNPWNTSHSTGGSSGGSAAAVAAGMVAVGHANDGGGSIRIPASECGLVGLKPTRARVSMGPLIGDAWMGATIDHVVTRSVRDSAHVLDAIHGAMPGDPYAAPTPLRKFADELGVDPGRLRIGVYTGEGGEVPIDAACVEAVRSLATRLAALGHHVEDAAPCIDDPLFASHFTSILVANMAADIAEIEELVGRPLTENDIEPDNRLYAYLGTETSAKAYLDSVAWMHEYQRRMAAWWTPATGTGFDLLLTPTIAKEPPPLGWLTDPDAGPGGHIREVMIFTAQFNITGQPAISLPMHWSASGLPIGTQLVAGYGREDVLIRVASQLESAHPWADRRPKVWGRSI